MVICAAVDCDSRSKGKKRLDGESVSFFGFPRDSKRRKLWITKIKRVGLVPTSNTKLCSRHFTADQFVGRQSRSFCSEIGYEHKVKQRLVPAAVPTIFHHSRPVAAPRASATSIARKRLVTNKVRIGLSHAHYSLCKFYFNSFSLLTLETFLDQVVAYD